MARRFQNLVDVRRYLASLINRTEEGKLDAAMAGRLCFIANSLSKIIEGAELEGRIADLEKKVGTGK